MMTQIGEDGLVKDEEIEASILHLNLIIQTAETETEAAISQAARSFLNHIRWCQKEIRNLRQREYTLQCMLHAEGKLPYDPDEINKDTTE